MTFSGEASRLRCDRRHATRPSTRLALGQDHGRCPLDRAHVQVRQPGIQVREPRPPRRTSRRSCGRFRPGVRRRSAVVAQPPERFGHGFHVTARDSRPSLPSVMTSAGPPGRSPRLHTVPTSLGRRPVRTARGSVEQCTRTSASTSHAHGSWTCPTKCTRSAIPSSFGQAPAGPRSYSSSPKSAPPTMYASALRPPERRRRRLAGTRPGPSTATAGRA